MTENVYVRQPSQHPDYGTDPDRTCPRCNGHQVLVEANPWPAPAGCVDYIECPACLKAGRI